MIHNAWLCAKSVANAFITNVNLKMFILGYESERV